MNATDSSNAIRIDLMLIADMIAPKARVLDVGCGEGVLLEYLGQFKQVDGRGIELSMAGVREAVRRGLSVIQGDADTDLKDYPSGSFDYVVLSQTLQATRNPRRVLEELLRIGTYAIVSFPNFAHWRNRLYLLLEGRMPVTDSLPYQWWDTPNIHFCTVRDFVRLCAEMGIMIEQSLTLDRKGRVQKFAPLGGLANALACQAVYRLRRAG
ncbi:MAG: methionine biosynthesis MetW [Rhodospirillaceae bacterium]|nr:MAG: methionine biosynthesis MetW [Rhodospirillaceae bacterium]